MQDKMQDEAGNIWEVDAQGNPVRLVQAAPSASRGRVFTLPKSPKELREEARQNAADIRAARGDARADRADARAQAEFDTKNNPAPAPGDSTKTGDDYLATLSPALAAQVKALAEGRRAFPTGAALRSPQVQELVAAATQYDPTLDAANAATRVATRKDFTSGKAAQNITAMNTALGHLASLSQAAAGLHNRSFPLWNTIANTAETATGDPRVKNFKLARDAVANELMKVFRSTGGSVSEIEEWQHNIDSSDSPDQLHATITKATELLRSRLDAMGDQYNRGMGKSGDPISLLSPHAQEVYNKIVASPGLDLGEAQDGGSGGGSGGGGGGGGEPPPDAPRYSVATGQTRTVHNAKVSAQIDAMMNAGASEAMINAVLKRQGLAPIDPVSHARAKVWMMQHPGKRYYGTDINSEEPLSLMEKAAAHPLAAGVTGTANALTMGGLDEGIGGINALINGTSWADETAKAEGAKKAMAALNPGSSIVGELVGTGLQGAGAAKILSKFPALVKAISTARGTLATGAGYGAVNGALESNDDRVGGAVGGGVGGAAGAAAGRYIVAPLAEKALRKWAPQATVTSAERALPAVPESVMTNLQDAERLGLPYSLADADPKLRMLAGSVARKSPNARQLAETVLEPRHLGQADRAVDAIDTHLAPITNIGERSDELIAAGNQASGPHYALARQRAAPVDPEIAAMLDTPAGKQALIKARELAANEGRDPNGIGFDLNEQGDVVLREMPSFETLQYVKRGLDSVVEGHRNAVGVLDLAGDPMAKAVNGLRGRFNERLGALNEHYAAGNAEYAKWAKQRDALEMGHGTLPNNGLPLRDFQAALANLPPEALPEAQRGFATSMADTANRARLVSDPYKTIYGSPLQQQKIGELFPEGAANFDRVNQLERDMAKTRYEAIGGSPTAARTAADQLFEGPAGTILDVGTGAMTGGGFPVATALKSGARLLGDNWRLGMGQKRADELAPALFNTDPSASIDYLSELFARQAALQARKQAYGAHGTALGALLSQSLIPAQ